MKKKPIKKQPPTVKAAAKQVKKPAPTVKETPKPVKKPTPTVKAAAKQSDRPDPFKGADDIYLTKRKIAIRTIATDAKGRLTDTTRYVARSAQNMRDAESVHGRLRKGR
jgi:outer membrane biosynthesis protein TonB